MSPSARGTLITVSVVGRAMAATIVASLVLGTACSEKDPGLRLVDRAANLGIDGGRHRTWSVDVADLDRDGDEDLFFVFHARSVAMYENDDGRFVLDEKGSASFVRRDRHDCAWGELSGDGLVDAYCSTGAHRGQGMGADELWVQRSDGTFMDEAADRGITDAYGRGRYVAVMDLDRDETSDLVVVNDARPDDDRSFTRIYRNVSGEFVDAPRSDVNGRTAPPLCLDVADVDADGLPEIYVCTGSGSLLFDNEGGLEFVDATESRGVMAGPVVDAAFGDIDADGDVDLVQATQEAVYVQLYDAGRFAAARRLHRLVPAGQANTAFTNTRLALGDADGDGRADVFVLRSRESGWVSATGPRAGCDRPVGRDQADSLLLMAEDVKVARAVTAPTTAGCGNDVEVIDITADGDAEFVVINGWLASDGPVQVLDLVTG